MQFIFENKRQHYHVILRLCSKSILKKIIKQMLVYLNYNIEYRI